LSHHWFNPDPDPAKILMQIKSWIWIPDPDLVKLEYVF
jgi:hypothetical protein